jgi:hypothetical protein
MGDAFPKLGPPQVNKQLEMERERALLSPVFEEQLGPPTTPALVVHVDIRFTDPVIRSRYSRSYGSSPTFEATNRICRGLVRRIERCCEEFVTRKDSSALEMFKGDTYERKPQRFEMTFRIMRRGRGEWAERTYRSYQKQPLTVAFTKEVMLAAHRMIGLFLRRHDQRFQWLDCPVAETDLEGSQTMVPSRGGPLSLLSVPRSRFIEATQMFEFVPGYTIELSFRSRNLQRQVPIFERRIRVNSTQPAPLTLFLSEDMLGKALQFTNQALDSKKRELDDELRDHGAFTPNPEDDTLEIGLRVSNNLGPVYSHVQRSIKSKLALFRDQDAIDCDLFLCDIEKYLLHIRNEADSTLNATNDLDFRIAELKGVGWTLRDPAKFGLGPSASYGRRTIQAALDRMQTGIGDVIRGHNIAIHITAHKRGHLILDKVIVAHEKHGKLKESFASREDAQAVFVARLKTRIQKDIDRVFEDSCSIDDIPEDEEDYFARPVTPAQPEQPVFEELSPRYSPSSIRSSPAKQSRPSLSSIQSSPRPRAQRVFSLSRRSTESMRSIDYLKAPREPLMIDGSRPITAASELLSELRARETAVLEVGGPLLAPAEVKPARSFSLVSRKSSSATRVSNASSLVEEQATTSDGADMDSLDHKQTEVVPQGSQISASSCMTSNNEGVNLVVARSGNFHEAAAQGASSASGPAVQQHEAPSRNDDTIDAPSTVFKAKDGKMETPETFEDAREYATSPTSEEKANPEPLVALARAVSPKEDDEFSTAPSTPELSTGASSPRHSVLVTPVYLRSHSGAREPVLQTFYPDSGPEQPAVHLQGEGTAEPVIKEDRDCAAALESQVDQHASSPPSQSVAEPSTAAESPEDAHRGDANRHPTAKAPDPDPAARAVSRDETPDDAKRTPTPRPPTASDASPSESSLDPNPASDTQIYHPPPLGAETPRAGSDTLALHTHAPPPDFPTPQVRTSHAREQPAHSRPVLDPEVRSANNKLQQESEVESELSYATESAGNELGAGTGAESRFGGDRDGREGIDDVGDALSGGECGAESGAGEVTVGVVAETGGMGTEEAVVEGREVDGDGGRVQEGNVGSERGEMEWSVGGDSAGDGPGVVAGGEEEKRVAAEDATAVNVGPAEETDVVRSGVDTDVRDRETSEERLGENDGTGSGTEAQLEAEEVIRRGDGTSTQPRETPEGRFEEDHGPGLGTEDQVKPDVAARDGDGTSSHPSEIPQNYSEEKNGPRSGAEAAHVETEEDLSDEVTDKANVDHPVVETSDEAEENTSGPEPLPEHIDPPAAVPEQEVHGQRPEPTVIGAEQDVHLQTEGNTLAEGPESQGAAAESNDTGTETPELNIGEAAQESVAEPAAAVDLGLREGDIGEVEKKELKTVPDVIGAEPPRLPIGKDAENGPDILSALAEVAEAEVYERGVGEKESGMAPSAPGADETEALKARVSKDTAGRASGIADVSDGVEAGSEAVAAEPAEGGIRDEPKVPVDGNAMTVPADEMEAPELEAGEKQLVEADGLTHELPDATDGVKSPGSEFVGQNLAQKLGVQTNGISRKESYESHKEDEPCTDAGVAGDSDISGKTLGPEVGTEETGEKLEKQSDQLNVCAEPGALEPQSYDKQAAPVISFDDLTTPISDTSKSPAETVKPDPPASIPVPPTTPPAADTPSPKLASSPPPRPEKLQEKPHLAPIPDLSKLSHLFPTPTRTSLSSDAASFTSIPRNSVDTIRPSTDDQQQRPSIPLSELPHTSSSRPQTAGYLGIGLCEPRNLGVGLRGALGDVKARRLSLPLQHLLDKEEATEGLAGERRASAPASEAGSKGSRLRKRRGAGKADEEPSVLPRMMMLLAGAVAIGKIMKRAAD